VVCRLPPATSPGIAPLEVSYPGVGSSRSGHVLETLLRPVVLSMTPSSGTHAIGSRIVISTSGFPEGATPFCAFSDAAPSPATPITASSFSCRLPPLPPGNVSLSLSADSSGGTAVLIPLEITPEMFLSSASPRIVPASSGGIGAIQITISGAGFSGPASEALRCAFSPRTGYGASTEKIRVGTSFTRVRYIDETRLACAPPAPPRGDPTEMALSLVDAAQRPIPAAARLRITLLPLPSATALTPAVASALGGTSVRFPLSFAAPYTSGVALVCRFGDAAQPSVPVSFVDASGSFLSSASSSGAWGMCRAPMHAPGVVRVQVFAEGLEGVAMEAELLYIPALTMGLLEPSAGSAETGTLVTVYGAGFYKSDAIACAFGDVTVAAMPPRSASARVFVRVSNNGEDFEEPGLVFLSSPAPSVVSLLPSVGVNAGGMAVTAVGASFVDSASGLATFGDLQVPTTFLTASSVRFHTPAHAAGTASVALRNDGSSAASAPLPFLFISPPSVYAILPRVVSREGGQITIAGAGFEAGLSEVWCRFGGSVMVSATVHSTTQLVCTAPPLASDSVTVEVSFNGLEYTSDGERLQYTDPAVVSAVTPSAGGAGGVVTLKGRGFPDVMSVRFGRAAVVAADRVSSSMALCRIPANAPPGNISLSVLYSDGSVSPGGVRFLVVSGVKRCVLAPSAGTVLGGAVVTVSSPDVQSGVAITCLFGHDSVPGKIVGRGSAECVVPRGAPGAVDLSVMLDGVDAECDTKRFVFESEADISSVIPSTSPSSGGVTCTLVGASFPPGGAVRFIDASGSHKDARATTVSSSVLTCVTPPLASGYSTVFVTLHGHQVSASVNYLITSGVSEVTSVAPTRVPSHSAQVLTITGRAFSTRESYTCAFAVHTLEDASVRSSLESGRTAASLESGARIECRVPVVAPGRYSVTVLASGSVLASPPGAHLTLEVAPSSGISSISPLAGPLGGGTKVTVSTLGDLASDTVWCSFGGMHVRATVLSGRDSVLCVAPQAPRAGLVPLNLAYGESPDRSEDASEDEMNRGAFYFRYLSAVSIAGVYPCRGSVSGGGFVRVTGSFPLDTTLSCSFAGRKATSSRTVSKSVLLCQSPPADAGKTRLEIRSGESGEVFASAGYVYEMDVTVSEITPRSVPIGRSAVTVIGRGFVDRGGSKCRVGFSQEFPARFVNLTTLVCQVDVRFARNFSLTVSNDGGVFSSSTAQTLSVSTVDFDRVEHSAAPESGGTLVEVFLTHEDLRTKIARDKDVLCLFGRSVAALDCFTKKERCTCVVPTMERQVDGVRPSTGDSAGGSVVTVAGSGFTEGTRVAFSAVGVDTVFVSASRVVCVVPAHEEGLSPVTVSNNGADFVGGGAEFLFAAPPTVRELVPSRRLLGAGSSTVTVLGAGFEESDSLSCRFGTQRAVPAAWSSSSMIVCSSAMQHTGQIAVQVSNDGTTFSALSLSLSTTLEMQLHALTPSQGFTQGKTLGRGFAAGSTSLTCTFVICAISANKPANVQVFVRDSNLASAANQQTPVTFLFTDAIVITSVIPSVGFVGASFMTTLVGTGFMPGGAPVACRFGDVADLVTDRVTTATVVSASHMQCVTPAVTSTGKLAVVITSAGNDGPASDPHFLLILPEVKLISMVPSSGPASGGTKVMLAAGNFPESGDLLCLFGSSGTSDGPASGASNSRRASRVTSSLVSCTTPPSLRSANVSVAISAEGAAAPRLTGALRFHYVAAPTLASIFPSLGPLGGGTVLVVAVVCHFDAPGGVLKGGAFAGRVSVPGVAMRRGLVQCVTPPASVRGAVTVRLSVGGGASANSLMFLYAPPFRVAALRPSIGGMTGGAVVTVIGVSFPVSSNVLCRFGAHASVRATLVSSTLLTCAAPPSLTRGAVALAVVAPNWSNLTPARDFLYVYEARVSGVRPSVAPAGRSVAVTVVGEALSSGVRCEFGTTDPHVSHAVMQTSSLVLCSTPAAAHPGASQMGKPL
ncbi:hypothetical protein T484DRAFT_1797520, partial [Baffinella frigidus]